MAFASPQAMAHVQAQMNLPVHRVSLRLVKLSLNPVDPDFRVFVLTHPRNAYPAMALGLRHLNHNLNGPIDDPDWIWGVIGDRTTLMITYVLSSALLALWYLSMATLGLYLGTQFPEMPVILRGLSVIGGLVSALVGIVFCRLTFQEFQYARLKRK